MSMRIPAAVLAAWSAISGLAGCRSIVFPIGRPYTGEYRIAFEDSAFVGMVGDTARLPVRTSPFSPGDYGFRAEVASLDPEIVRPDSNGNAVSLKLGRTLLVASLRDEDGKLLSADTLAATVPVEKVRQLYSSYGDCAEVRILKGTGPGGFYLVNRGLYKSADYGITWDSLRIPETEFRQSAGLAVNPFRGRELYWMRWDKPVQRSVDDGATWEDAFADHGIGALGIVFHPRIPDRMYLLARERDTLRLFRSDDGGAGFARLSDLPDYRSSLSLLFDPADDRILYLSPTPYRSKDGGSTWEATPFELEYQSIAHFQVDGRGRLYARHRTLLRSDDHGDTWETLFPTLAPNPFVRDLVVPSGDSGMLAFFAGSPKSIYYSDNDGYAWKTVSLGRFSLNSCMYGDIARIRDSPLEFLVSDGLFVWRYRHFGD